MGSIQDNLEGEFEKGQAGGNTSTQIGIKSC
jgi:hypothetical protein